MDTLVLETPSLPTSQNSDNSEFYKGLHQLSDFSLKIEELEIALKALAQFADVQTQRRVVGLQERLRNFEPSVTIIGQVKAGKSSLLNAMAGWPDLLPADVNPWTSVVTSLHLTPCKTVTDTAAKFSFFEMDEWDGLLHNGGRLGELANRAGADEEVVKLRHQLDAMREKTRSRLGRKFELLLGQVHNYLYFDQELIERYVCLGDLIEDGDAENLTETQGRFADITKSADLFLHRSDLPTNLCFRDTPGVNDTFMVREQTTIRAIRDSRLCVVVLSAHQALSSVDMALIRLITNIQAREVIIFVNRIDELPDPERQIAEIRHSIQQTLRSHRGPDQAKIVFGSALWANQAITSDESCTHEKAKVFDAQKWESSGIPELFTALAERIVESEGQDLINSIIQSAINLAQGLQIAQTAAPQIDIGAVADQLDEPTALTALDKLEQDCLELLDTEFVKLTSNFGSRLDVSHNSFLERATSSLIAHLDKYGEDQVWEYSPDGLRMMLNSSYALFGNRLQKLCTQIFQTAASTMAVLFEQVSSGLIKDHMVQTPLPPRLPPPVFLGQTIALDLKGPWWKSWWVRLKGQNALAESFHQMIKDETAPIVDELRLQQSDIIKHDLTRLIREFFNDQRAIFTAIYTGKNLSAADFDEVLHGSDAIAARQSLKVVLATFNTLRLNQKEMVR